ncbi:MAG: DHHW family protein [Romboutsia sp.]
MKINKDNILKYVTIVFFLGFIFIFPIINFLTPDKKINEMENKILSQSPDFSLGKVYNGSFMKDFDSYTSDQFPFRTEFIEFKNYYNYGIGHKEFRDIYVSNSGRLMEKFVFNKDIIDKNIAQVIDVSCYLKDNYSVSSTIMIVPTSIAFYENDLPGYAITDNQLNALKYINSEIDAYKVQNYNIKLYSPYSILEKNKNEYIYFNTDHHWTQLGAKLAFEDLYGEVTGDYSKISDNFYGTYYSKALLPQIKGDTIFSYDDYKDFDILIDFDKNYDTLYNDTKLNGKNKYQYFLHGDPALAVIEGNPNSIDEILVYKDSYAHNFVPFLTSKYKKIHVIDPRYYKLNIDDYFSKNKDIKDVLFLNNISTFNSSDIIK